MHIHYNSGVTCTRFLIVLHVYTRASLLLTRLILLRAVLAGSRHCACAQTHQIYDSATSDELHAFVNFQTFTIFFYGVYRPPRRGLFIRRKRRKDITQIRTMALSPSLRNPNAPEQLPYNRTALQNPHPHTPGKLYHGILCNPTDKSQHSCSQSTKLFLSSRKNTRFIVLYFQFKSTKQLRITGAPQFPWDSLVLTLAMSP